MRFISISMLLFACGNDQKENDVPPLSSSGDDDATCGGAAPIIDDLTCINSGLNYSEDEGIDLPTITIMSHVTDADEDLTDTLDELAGKSAEYGTLGSGKEAPRVLSHSSPWVAALSRQQSEDLGAQAWFEVTFEDVAAAEAARKAFGSLYLDGKPVVVAFGISSRGHKLTAPCH